MDSKKINEWIMEIRNNLELTRGVDPIVENIVETEDTVTVIVGDRAEKSQCIGPGGRIAAELSKKINKQVSILSLTEIEVRKRRLELTLQRIDELKKQTSVHDSFLEYLENRITFEIDHPYSINLQIDAKKKDQRLILVAYSGGTDSSASLLLLKRWGYNPLAVTSDAGPRILPPNLKEQIKEICSIVKVDHEFIDVSHDMQVTISGAIEGRFHPCGSCHSITMNSITEYALRKKIGILVTGELLPHGRQALEINGNLLLVHLPAALALTKFKTVSICGKEHLNTQSHQFGCQFLSQIHGTVPGMIQPSIDRVLRELEAGILTNGKALSYIKYILRQSNKSGIDKLGD